MKIEKKKNILKLFFCPTLHDILKDENCDLLSYDAASSGNSVPTFRDNLLVPSSRVKYPRRLTPADGTDRLSRNVEKELPLLTYLLTYLLTPWSRVLLEKLTSKLCS